MLCNKPITKYNSRACCPSESQWIVLMKASGSTSLMEQNLWKSSLLLLLLDIRPQFERLGGERSKEKAALLTWTGLLLSAMLLLPLVNDLGLRPEGLQDLLVHRPPDVPVFHLLRLLRPFRLLDCVRKKFEQGVWEALDDLVHFGRFQVLFVELAGRVVLLQLLHCHFERELCLLLDIFVKKSALAEHLVRRNQLSIRGKHLCILEAKLCRRVF